MTTLQLKSQEIIDLPIGIVPSTINWPTPEREYHSTTWDNPVISNVSQPQLEVFRPDPAISNGSAIIVCPGGGMYALSIDSEGRDVARWLAKHGVTALVLKYRLVPTGVDGTQDLESDGAQVIPKAKELLPIAVEDGLNAMTHVRTEADTYGINPAKVGLMGFSAGGAVAMGVTYAATAETRPDYLIPIYAWMNIVEEQEPPNNPPPIFIVCASDDPLLLAPASVKIYQQWLNAGSPSELHMYAQGGHGFGMKSQGLPSDQWIDRLGEWLTARGLIPQ